MNATHIYCYTTAIQYICVAFIALQAVYLIYSLQRDERATCIIVEALSYVCMRP